MDAPTPAPQEALAPTPAAQRIEALDVVRGFALIGICLMNLDFFNRSVLNVGTGMPPDLAGIDYAAAFFTGYFVTGKFWTMFSLLFGMGFAVMLNRAEVAGRPFLAPYLRRIAALAVFGALHDIFIWGGDILFSYAMGAAFLLLVEYASWKVFTGATALSLLALAIPGATQFAGGLAATLASAGLVALYLRGPSRTGRRPVASLVLLAASGVALLAGAVLWVTGIGPQLARGLALAIGLLLLVTAWLIRFREPASSRAWRIGVALWAVTFGISAIVGASNYVGTPPATPGAAARPAVAASAGKPGDKAAEREAERAKALKDRAQRVETDARTMSTGSYADAVALRAEHFATRPQRQLSFSVLLIAVFLIGAWFVRSGVMANTAAHLPLFRRLAFIGIPVGVGVGLLGSTVATHWIPGVNDQAWQLASALLMLGNLPASVGYASAVILMLHSRSVLSRVRVLAPFGRMALTNYILQSLVCTTLFYGYGFGLWGMGRAAQLAVALALCAVLVATSHLWLARFRYGPLEWLWRAVTYLRLPAMRVERTPLAAVPQPN